MTKEQIKAVLDRVLTWPPDRQEAAADMLLVLESQEGEFYHPSPDELTAIREGLAQIDRGESISEEELEARWKRRRS
jgi:hypothetical protein